MKSIVALCLALLFAVAADASSIRGFIQKKSQQKSQLLAQLDDGTESIVELKASTPQLQANLDKLKLGDYVVARGTITGTEASIDSIESLGLKGLVGTWSAPGFEFYEFKDFTQLNLYVPNSERSDVVKAREYQYSIAPDSGARYQLFLSSNDSIVVGSLEFRKSLLVLKVIDPKTGVAGADILLSPLAPPPDSSNLQGK